MEEVSFEMLFSNCDDLPLGVALVLPKDEVKAVVQFSHGMAEHKERYFDFMKYLASFGYACVIHDHRGHGESVKSEKDFGYFYTENVDFVVDDLKQVTELIKERFKNVPIYMFSHSMGTLVSRCYLQKYDNLVEKVVLCGPPTENKAVNIALILAKIVKPFKRKNTPNNFLNKLTFASYGKSVFPNAWICKNVETVKKYNADKMCGFVFTTNGFINLYYLMKRAFEKKRYKIQNKNLKIFVIAGELDPVIISKKKFGELLNFLKEIGYKNIKSKIYSGLKHELLNELENLKVYEDVLNFYEKE